MMIKIVPCYDRQRRTCLEVARIAGQVKFIPLDIAEGLQVQMTSADSFDQRYQPMVNYPAEKAAQLYLSYGQTIGATKEALDYLGQVIHISEQEFKMATTKKTVAATASEKKLAQPKPAKASTKEPKPAKAAATKEPKPAKVAATKEPKANVGEKRPSAAQVFKDLIMAGKLTDNQIFERVKNEFGLEENKRAYVNWYRNYLRKQGMNPPEPKV
jgi:hypothetical protein